MKHATPATLDTLEELIAAVRKRPELIERTRGHFYRKSAGFLHFHEDLSGVYADLKAGRAYELFPVNTSEERDDLVARIALLLDG
jgi:hypothetical protein